MTTQRLPLPAGRRIDRSRPLAFEFEGRSYEGYAGDTVASALAACGVWSLSRSFKLHRLRGPFSFAGEEASTLVQLDDEPNVHADVRGLESGMSIWAQNTVGGLASDRASIIGRFERFLPVGFYYKAFYRPRGVWNLWEKIIRRVAGLGRVDLTWCPEYFDKKHGHCDVAVIGGGAAGMSTALACGARGLDVMLIEREPELGGWLTYARSKNTSLRNPVQELRQRVLESPSVRVMTNSVCTGWFADNWLSIAQSNRLYKIRPKSVVACTGAVSQPAIFRNNDLPGVISSSGVQRLIRLYGVRPGVRAVVLTAGDEGYGAALDLADHGTEVACVVDLRDSPGSGEFVAECLSRGLRVLSGQTVREAWCYPHQPRIGGVLVTDITGPYECADDGESINCDLLCVAVGSAPSGGLLLQAGAEFARGEGEAVPHLASVPAGVFAAGAVAGTDTVDAALLQGTRVGQTVPAEVAGLFLEGEQGRSDAGSWPLFPHPRGHEFVDLDEDVTVREILDAIAEGFGDLELLKRYTTAGMGPSQGRHSAVAISVLTARATGSAIASMGGTTSRPPVYPERFGLLAGRRFQPVRRTPMHGWHLEAGAQMMTAGVWMRPSYYGQPDEREAAITREVISVRRAAGLIDVSTLGGFEIRGPDAVEFLERAYTTAFSRQRTGRTRYALLTDESGVILDDGVAARIGPDHFYVTASTSGADQLYPKLLWYQAQWQLDVDIADVTSAYGAMNIAGPAARDVLCDVATDIDFSSTAFPYLGFATGQLGEADVRVMRIGFVGELGYEIHVPWSQCRQLWRLLIEAGRLRGIRPFGVEAQRVLRLEKGHVIVTQDTDGLTNPYEADLGWAIGRRKRFFVGKRSIEILREHGIKRHLVGYSIPDRSEPVPEEGCLVIRGDEITGRVTSSAWSPVLERAIGLAYVSPDQAEVGTGFTIKAAAGRHTEARVAKLPFYDPGNIRQGM